MDHNKATEVLHRFEPVIKNVARGMAENFPSVTEYDDACQDASLLVLSYAGLADSQFGRGHVGALTDAEADAEGDEKRVQNIITTKLRLDLSRYYGREAEKRVSTVSYDQLPETAVPDDFAASVAGDIIPNKFPFLFAHYGQEMTSADIADRAGISRSTVTRKIAAEKREFVVDYVRRAGLVVEGDETTAELVEAYGHLKAAGR